MANFYLIGLTGNLGSGKSTVRRILEELGAFGLDADKLGHVAMMRGTPAWNEIIQAFGPDILRYNGKIDRQALGARVFRDPEALHRLESILHPAVGELIKQSLRETAASVVVLEAIKLVEAGLNQWCDALWVVTAAPQVQLERVMRDRHMSAQDARARLEAQGPMEGKLRIANVIIDNSYDLNTTRLQVQNAWKTRSDLAQARDKDAWLYSRPGQRARDLTPESAETQPPKTVEPPAPEQPPESAASPSKPTASDAEPPAASHLREITVSPFRVTSEPKSPPAGEEAPGAPPGEQQMPVEQEHTAGTTSGAKSAGGDTERARQDQAQAAPASSERSKVTTTATIQVRRARRTDIDALGAALAKSEGQSSPLPRLELIKRVGEQGYRIAVAEDKIVALAAWEAENLVATTRELWAESPEMAARALPPLLAMIEQDARTLLCEVLIALVGEHTPEYVVDQVRASMFEPRAVRALYRLWREAVEERSQPGDQIWVKVLRDGVTTKPI